MKRPSLVLVACLLSSVLAVAVDTTREQISSYQTSNVGKAACASALKDNWGNCVAADRKVVSIRASANEKDDVSADFEKGLRDANNGGLLRLEKGKLYVIGKKLDLSFLNDVYVQLDGEIKVWRDSF